MLVIGAASFRGAVFVLGESMTPEVWAAIASMILSLVLGLLGVVWFLLWTIIEGLRKDISGLRESVIELQVQIGQRSG